MEWPVQRNLSMALVGQVSGDLIVPEGIVRIRLQISLNGYLS